MKSELCVNMGRTFSRANLVRLAVLAVLVSFGGAVPLQAQFSSGSDGSDGAYAPSGPPGTIVTFNPSQFTGTQVSANIFNFTTITIPAGVTVRLSGNVMNKPVFWRAQGDVSIAGTIDLSGGLGQSSTTNPFARVPSESGAGGYAGGVGGNATQAALPGSGPGGGAALNNAPPAGSGAGPGIFSGNQFVIPLVGGSGGAGGFVSGGSTFGAGGGAGGGALLIAGSTQIIVNGLINANGGTAGTPSYTYAGGGSGGAIRLVSNTIAGTGSLTATGGYSAPSNGGPSASNGGPGLVRVETNRFSFTGTVQGTFGTSTPFPLLLPTVGPATASVISINGVPVSPNPATFPDITINTASAVPVVIQTHNIPTTATINLTILDENGVADTVISAPPLGNCDGLNNCTTTVNVIFPFGASRGLTKLTWTQ